jgi:lysophospholipase L1-like esterase
VGGTLTATTVTVGDSWYGNANPPYAGFYMGAYFAAHPEHAILNLGKGGTGLDWITTKRAEIAAAKPYVVILSFGRNDFMSTVYGGTSDATNYSTYVTFYLARINEIKTDNPGVAVIVETLTEQHTTNAIFNTAYNGFRKTLNGQIRLWKATGVIAEYIDIGAEATIGADGRMIPGSPETADGTHLNEGPNGHGKALSVFAPTMDAFYAARGAP